ncbi:hypothetical protein LTR53_003344 [Teratosphaeriaceae sp. CCFEE 6253]|nr:hypothetical protein LTR53_003344 [Teratosphaeriaceae sp. CCFEE 6253]
MPPRPYPNLERSIIDRYNAAQAFLATDAEAAERIFLELLNEPRLPLWIRTQCNVNLALLTDDLSAAPLYLLDARHALDLYEAANAESWSESVTSNVANMKAAFTTVDDRIAYRLAHPEEEDEPEDGAPKEDESDEDKSDADECNEDACEANELEAAGPHVPEPANEVTVAGELSTANPAVTPSGLRAVSPRPAPTDIAPETSSALRVARISPSVLTVGDAEGSATDCDEPPS